MRDDVVIRVPPKHHLNALLAAIAGALAILVLGEAREVLARPHGGGAPSLTAPPTLSAAPTTTAPPTEAPRNEQKRNDQKRAGPGRD